MDRELEEIEQFTPPPAESAPPFNRAENTLADRRDELDALSPAMSDDDSPTFDSDLTGNPQQEVALSLEDAVVAAIEHNLDIRRARLQPTINEEDLVAAEAIFDALFFASANLTRTDQPQATPVLGGIPLGAPVSVSESNRFETGIRKRLTSGGNVTLSTDLSRFRTHTPGFNFSPDPAYTTALRLGLTQPLLRGFGQDINTASIQLAGNAADTAVAGLHAELLALAEKVEIAYWNLAFSRRNLTIVQWLVEQGESVRQVLEARLEFDTLPAQYADAVATVERRRAEVIRATRQVRAASDVLKQLINRPDLPLGSESILTPTTVFPDSPIALSLRDMLETALHRRPEIRQSLLAIDDADIRRRVADNAVLPLLNLTGELAYFGLNDDPGSSFNNSLDNEFIDYAVGLSLEIPLGNRAAEAGARRERLRHASSVIDYERTVQRVVLEVKAALRDVAANHRLVAAMRSVRIAQAENLRALLVEEEMMAGLTPTFLNLKFQRQEGLANARREEVQALVNYDNAVANLYRALGTGLEMKGIQFPQAGVDGASSGSEDAPDS